MSWRVRKGTQEKVKQASQGARQEASTPKATEDITDDTHQEDVPLRVWLPGMPLEEGEELQADPSAYVMLHSFSLGWPCLSFDFIPTNMTPLASPLSLSVVSGTQAGDGRNEVFVVNWSNLINTLQEDSDESG